MGANYFLEVFVMTKTRKLTTMAMLTAVSVAFCALIHFPIIPAAPFLEFDPGVIPILIGSFMFGPLAGFLMTVVTAVIQGLTVSAASGWYGIIMHIIATGTCAVVAGVIYMRKKSFKRAIISIIAGALSAVIIMIPANLIITPLFTGMPTQAIADLLLPGIIPFNLVKFGINAVVTFLVYKPISNLVKKPIKKQLETVKPVAKDG